MPFPNPQPTVTTQGSGRSPEALANQAAEARRAEQIAEALKVQHKPMMVASGAEPTEAELARERNARLMRQGNEARSYRDHIEAILAERDDVAARLAGFRQRADAALREGRVSDVRRARGQIEDAAIESDQLVMLEDEARVGLARAERAEAVERETLQAQVPPAEKAVVAFKKAMQEEYPGLASRLKDLQDMEAQSDAALALLRQAAMKIPGYAAPAAPSGPRLRGALVVPGYVTPPRQQTGESSVYAR